MKLRTIKYYISEAFRSIIVNRLMSVASIFTVASCIFIVSVFFILGTHVSFFVQQLGDSLGLAVFIEEGLSPSEVALLERRVREIPHITSVRYVSADEGFREFKQRMGENAAILEGLEENHRFRASFEIEVADVQYHEQVDRALENLVPYGVARVRNDSDVARILSTLTDVVRFVSVLLILILGIVAIVIIANTINITVNARRTEINIMKYVGATDWFIRWPFIIEGVIIGLVGGLLPIILTWFTHDGVISTLNDIPELGFIAFVPRNQIFSQLVPFVLLLGTVIGLVGSGVSVRRHLKV